MSDVKVYLVIAGIFVGIIVTVLLLNFTGAGVKYDFINEQGQGVYRINRWTGDIWFCHYRDECFKLRNVPKPESD